MIVYTWVSCARVEEQLSVDPLHSLMMCMAKDNHIGIRKILGKRLMITFKPVPITKSCPLIEQVMPHCSMSVRQGDPDTVGCK